MALELAEKTPKELREIAKKLELKLPAAMGKEKLIDAIDKELIKKHLRIEAEARAELRAEAEKTLGIKPGAKIKPSPETLAIEKSPKVIVLFVNRENPMNEEGPGADLEFDAGEKYHFHLYDNKKHVLPECLVSQDKKDAWISRAQICVAPVYGNRTLPGGEVIPAIVGSRPRFMFQILGPAPKGADFGIYLEEKQEVKV